MRQRRDIFDRLDRQSRRLQARNGAFTPRPGTLDTNFDFFDTEFGGLLSTGFCGTLCGKRSALTAPLEARSARRRPAQHIAIQIGDCDGRVIERRLDVRDGTCDVPANFLPNNFAHSSTPYADANVTLRPDELTARRETQSATNLPGKSFMINQTKPRCTRYRISLTPFLPATVLRTPLRVRALVRVRCPLTGKPRRCLRPR